MGQNKMAQERCAPVLNIAALALSRTVMAPGDKRAAPKVRCALEPGSALLVLNMSATAQNGKPGQERSAWMIRLPG